MAKGRRSDGVRWRRDAVDACKIPSQSPGRRTKAREMTHSGLEGLPRYAVAELTRRGPYEAGLGENQPRKLLILPQSGRAGLRSASFARESKGVFGRWIVTCRRAPTVRSTGRSMLPP